MIVRVFKAVTFFFELHGPLVQDGARYKCRGAILSRSLNSRDLLQTIRANYPYTQLFFNETSLGFVGPTDLCDLCGRFRKEVSFHVRHPTDRVNVYLAFNRLFHRSISAFPTSMKWIEDKQRLNARFGQHDHRSRLERQARELCCGEIERLIDRPHQYRTARSVRSEFE